MSCELWLRQQGGSIGATIQMDMAEPRQLAVGDRAFAVAM